MSTYLDASVLVSLFLKDELSARAEALVVGQLLITSDFGYAELASAVARRVRTGDVTNAEAASAFENIDTWRRSVQVVSITSADIARAEELVRRLILGLRAPDALHIVVAQRLGVPLATFDQRMAGAAATLGVSVLA